MFRSREVALAACVLILATSASAAPPANPILQTLLNKGVEVAPGRFEKIPPPTLAPDMAAAAQTAAIKKLCAERKVDYANFMRDALGAPAARNIKSVQGSDKKLAGKLVEMWFICYGDMKTIREQNLFSQKTQSEKKAQPQDGETAPAEKRAKTDDRETARALEPKEIQSRNLQAQQGVGFETGFLALDFGLLNQVQLTGLARFHATYDDPRVEAATMFDPALIDDKEFPTQWQPINIAAGVKKFGDPMPYSGFGGYAVATELVEPKGAVLVEAHLIFSHPPGWFNGKDLLPTKLPLVIDEKVKSFRAELKKALKNAKPKPKAAAN